MKISPVRRTDFIEKTPVLNCIKNGVFLDRDAVFRTEGAKLPDTKKELRKPLLLPLFSCHHLRHTICTRFCENETKLKVIQEIMGHADITTTMDVYNEATKDKKTESFSGLEGKMKIS